MNILIRELKANFRSLLFWSLFAIFFIYMGISKFEAFTASGSDVMDMINTIPEAVLEAFQLNTFNLTTISGYYGVMYTYFVLLAAVFAVLLGNGIIAKEERDKTVEFSLTLPISRHWLVTWKTLAAVVNCVLFTLVIWGGSIAFVQPFKPDADFYEFLQIMMVSIFILELVFLAVGVLLGAALKDYKRSGSIAVGLLFGTFIFSILSGLSERLDFLKYASPFSYFDPLMMLNESRVEPLYLGLSAGVIVLSMVGAYLTYQRRDLYI